MSTRYSNSIGLNGMRRPRLRTGELREKYTAQRLSDHSSGYTSGQEEDWAELTTFRAKLTTSRGVRDGEQELADTLRTINTVELVAHYNSTLASLTENDRLVDARSGAILNIRHVDNPDGRKELIYIAAEKGRPNG